MSINITTHYVSLASRESDPCLPRKTAKLSSNVTLQAWRGRIVHLNSSGEFEMGCPAGSALDPKMFYIILSGAGQPSTHSPPGGGNPVTDPGPYVGVHPEPGQHLYNAVPVTFGGEVVTTEFDAGESYPVNAALTATASNSVQATGGVVKPGTLGSVPIIGLVSTPPGDPNLTTPAGRRVIRFWAWLFPRLS